MTFLNLLMRSVENQLESQRRHFVVYEINSIQFLSVT